jgi:WhiB family redox-sensing transcriptional regulator
VTDDWRTQAACRGEGINTFYSPAAGSIADAKKVCRGCPVRQQCLDDALRRGDRYGVWGGLTPRERARLRRRTRRAGQAKTAPPPMAGAVRAGNWVQVEQQVGS